jgi:uncharacterized protein (DUF1800 family)
MEPAPRTVLRTLLCAGLAWVSTPAPAADAAAALQAPLCDPCVPPGLRNAQPLPQTSGAALRAQVEQKLRARFEAADTLHTGALTREQARAAGLGVVARNFDRIDRTGSGKVTFADLMQYLRARGARF